MDDSGIHNETALEPKPKFNLNWQNIASVLKNGKKILFPLLSIAVLTASTFIGARLVRENQEIRERASTNGTALSINPSLASLRAGETVAVEAAVNTGEDTISAVELHITYDAEVLEAQSITGGNFLPVILVNGTVGGGNASITLGSLPTEPKQGTGILASITFRAIKDGTTTIAYANTTQVAAIGQTTNALDSSAGSQITVATEGSPGPSPSPSASPASGPGDVNTDGIVNIVDLGIILDNLDSSPPNDPRSDINGDNVVNIVDIGIVIDNLD